MTPNLKRVAYGQIRSRLLSGHFPAGARLSPASLAKELGISRTPVREAISQLETEGFVEQIPRLGHQVKRFDRADLVELFELRQFLEKGAVTKAAERITPREVDQLWCLCDEYVRLAYAWRDESEPAKAAELATQWVCVDAAFHVCLLGASGNRRLVKLASDMQMMACLFRRHVEIPRLVAMGRIARTHREHCRIVRALAKRDAVAAVAATVQHLEVAKAYYLHVYDNFRRSTAPGSDAELNWSRELLASIEPGAPQ